MIWSNLKTKHYAVRERTILDLFDETRGDDFSVETAYMRFDYSKTNIDVPTRKMLITLADDAGVAARRDAMFSGKKINETEGRSVLHTALRNLDGSPVIVDGIDVMPKVLATLERLFIYANEIRQSNITDVVNIGIGGSDLGPAMAVQALSPYQNGLRCHFVSNVDGANIADVLCELDAKKTLVIVASKTFTTIETMTNARTARVWMKKNGGDISAQFVALSSNLEKTAEFGIPPERVFGFEDWVGGRYSIWGPIGLSIMLAIGSDNFRDFLRGAEEMDRHFCDTKGAANMPLMLALTGIWHRQICGFISHAVLPYDQRLVLLPSYLQQLEMESNGKSVTMDGSSLTLESGPLVWGAPGTNGQHAFYQLLHQGTTVIPCEFMIAAKGHETELSHHHDLLVANCLAQSEALMRGRSLNDARALLVDKFNGPELCRQAAHRVFSGNRPSTTLMYPKLDPFTLGQIIALYEHRVFVEGVILGINSFDQWGVELGKELAMALQPIVIGKQTADTKDSSTKSLVAYLHRQRI